jgi:hypothetical protein
MRALKSSSVRLDAAVVEGARYDSRRISRYQCALRHGLDDPGSGADRGASSRGSPGCRRTGSHARTRPSRRGAHEVRSIAGAATARPTRPFRPCAKRLGQERLGRGDQSLRRNARFHPAIERVEGVKYYIEPVAPAAMRHPRNHEQADVVCIGAELLRQGIVVRDHPSGTRSRQPWRTRRWRAGRIPRALRSIAAWRSHGGPACQSEVEDRADVLLQT